MRKERSTSAPGRGWPCLPECMQTPRLAFALETLMSSSSKYKLVYIWLDGYTPEPNLRSKTKVVDKAPTSVAICPCGALTAARPARRKARAPTAC